MLLQLFLRYDSTVLILILRKDIREEETPSVQTEKTNVLGQKSTTKVKVVSKITEFVWKYEVRSI
jgi:hypothetical protein